ncbi:MAG: alpha/beta fold hydrolase [Pseudomonadales bacterium]|nr:alpha/beta fold hydrolase [Pseudomonadales bacterium]
MSSPYMLIYIHGFGSSPSSWKAQLMQQEIAARPPHQIEIPLLPFSPKAAMAQLEALIKRQIRRVGSEHLCLIGSSLGGFYATYLAHTYDLKAILINPAVQPYISLEKYLGENRNYHTAEVFVFHPYHIDELKQYDIHVIQKPEHFLVMLQTADDVLDYRQAAEKFSHSPLVIQEGGSHGFDDFDKMIPKVLEFAGIID